VANDTTGWRPIVFDVEHALEGADDQQVPMIHETREAWNSTACLWSLFNVAAIYARA
jgi:hypothetical protein